MILGDGYLGVISKIRGALGVGVEEEVGIKLKWLSLKWLRILEIWVERDVFDFEGWKGVCGV